MTMLTPEEIKTLDAVNGIVPDLYAAVERIVTARVSAALREAADEVYGDQRAEGNLSHPLSIQGWLRDRADQYDRTATTEGSE